MSHTPLKKVRRGIINMSKVSGIFIKYEFEMNFQDFFGIFGRSDVLAKEICYVVFGVNHFSHY